MKQCDCLDSDKSCGMFSISRFLLLFFFYTWTVISHGFIVQGTKFTIYALFITVYILKNIKNRSHGTIYTFKNYFVTILSIFSFQFSISVIINSVQTDSLYHTHQKGRKKMTYGFVCFWAGSKDWEWDRVQYRSFFFFWEASTDHLIDNVKTFDACFRLY